MQPGDVPESFADIEAVAPRSRLRAARPRSRSGLRALSNGTSSTTKVNLIGMLDRSMERGFAVIGLGYVGLPVALALAKKFEPVIGFDISKRRIAALRNGQRRDRRSDRGGAARDKTAA